MAAVALPWWWEREAPRWLPVLPLPEEPWLPVPLLQEQPWSPEPLLQEQPWSPVQLLPERPWLPVQPLQERRLSPVQQAGRPCPFGARRWSPAAPQRRRAPGWWKARL